PAAQVLSPARVAQRWFALWSRTLPESPVRLRPDRPVRGSTPRPFSRRYIDPYSRSLLQMSLCERPLLEMQLLLVGTTHRIARGLQRRPYLAGSQTSEITRAAIFLVSLLDWNM